MLVVRVFPGEDLPASLAADFDLLSPLISEQESYNRYGLYGRISLVGVSSIIRPPTTLGELLYTVKTCYGLLTANSIHSSNNISSLHHFSTSTY